jgi:shikimate dehydrogenase
MEISGATRIAAVIGSPVRHSLSPAIHNAGFEDAGVDWRFVALEVEPGCARDAVSAMRTLGIRGLAVTMPHKEQVAACVDEVDDAATMLRSVNTVVLRDDGTTYGTSTDGAGFVDSLAASGVGVAGKRIVVLGAGGAGRAIVDALGRSGVADIAIVNRTESAAASAAELATVARVGSPSDVVSADLLVNATAVGMASSETPIAPAMLRPDLAVADIVYHPLETALLRSARDAGAVVVDGLGMLVHQAVRQQELWTGVRPDPHALRSAAERELSRRAG